MRPQSPITRGLVQFSAAPRFSPETAVWTEFSYDVLGRQTQLTHPDGNYGQLIYDPDLVTSIDENGHIKRYFASGASASGSGITITTVLTPLHVYF